MYVRVVALMVALAGCSSVTLEEMPVAAIHSDGKVDPLWGAQTTLPLVDDTVQLVPHGVSNCPEPLIDPIVITNCAELEIQDGALVLPRTAALNASISWVSTAPLGPIPTLYWRHSSSAEWQDQGSGSSVMIDIPAGRRDDPNATASNWEFLVRANVFSVGIHDVTVEIVADRESAKYVG